MATLKKNIIVVDPQSPIIEVNGNHYQKIEKHKTGPLHGKLAAIMMMYGLLDPYGLSRRNSLPEDIDIVTEYGLIELKKSKLSRANRDRVVALFNKIFIKVEKP